MQLQDLVIYQQLYEQRSINRVAKLMGFAQSNITARLQTLEQEFGVRFFTRDYHGITPTANGQRFYHYAQQVNAQTAQIREQMQAATMPLVPHIVMSQLLFDLLVVQEERYSLAANTYELLSSTAILALKTPVADLVITYANFHHVAYAQTASAYLAASFWQAGDASVPFLVNSDVHCPFRARTLRYLHQDRRTVQAIDDWASIQALVRAGRGRALLPDALMQGLGLQRYQPTHRFRIPYATFQRK